MKAGDTIEIPHENERWTIVRSAIESGGGDFVADLEMPANASGPPTHAHMHEDEDIEVFAGSVTYFMPNGPVTVKAGETFRIPAGTPHTFKIGPDGVRARGRYNGRRFEELVAQLAPGDKRGFVRMAQHARRTKHVGSRMQSPLVRALLAVIAGVGWVVGIRPRPV